MRARSLSLFSLAAALLAAGCWVKRPTVKAPGDPDVGVIVTWHGHACFTVEDSVGRRFFIDPFDETVGYKVVWNDPDAVLVTDDHFDHNALRTGRYDLVNTTGVTTAAGVEVTGLSADHDDEGGARHGKTRVYTWTMGGVSFAHLGGIGQKALTGPQRDALKGVDVLFVPVGGKVTVDGRAAAALVRQIAPRIVVPMQYAAPQVRGFEFDPVEPFLDAFDDVVELPDSRFQVRREALPEKTTVYLPALPE